MSTILEQFDAYAAQQISEIQKKCSYLTKSRRIHDALRCLNQELPRRKLFFANERKRIWELLATKEEGDLDKALEIYDRILGVPYEAVLEFNIPRQYSPRSTIRTKQKSRVFNAGGPAHPNILSRKMKNSNGVRSEFRRAARLTFKKSKKNTKSN
jgi:hypothetical protein